MGRPGPESIAKRQREQKKAAKRRAKKEKMALRKAQKNSGIDTSIAATSEGQELTREEPDTPDPAGSS